MTQTSSGIIPDSGDESETIGTVPPAALKPPIPISFDEYTVYVPILLPLETILPEPKCKLALYSL